MAFYHFLAIFPCLLVLFTISARVPHVGDHMKNALQDLTSQVLPNQASQLFQVITDELNDRTHSNVPLISVCAAGLWAAFNGTWAMIYGLNKAYEVDEHRSWWEMAITIAGLTFFLVVVGSMAVFLIFCTAYLRTQFHGSAIALRLLEWLVLTGALFLVCSALPLCAQSPRLCVALEHTRRILCSRSMDRLDDRHPALLRARKQLLPHLWPFERRGHAPAVALRQQRRHSHRRRNELGDRKEYSGK